MTDKIQRYAVDCKGVKFPDDQGEVIYHDDHLAAIEAKDKIIKDQAAEIERYKNLMAEIDRCGIALDSEFNILDIPE